MAKPIRFLVVVPTHRPIVAQPTIDKIRESLTYPSDFVQLDGSRSKEHALNHALVNFLDASRHTIYCTVDDDLILPLNWQHFVACAFDRVDNLGICGLDLAGTEIGNGVMADGMKAPMLPVADILFRDTVGIQNVAGACMSMPTAIAKQIGQYPLAGDGRKYHLEEDSWRCHRCISLGYRYGYVHNPNGIVTLLKHLDDPQYTEKKHADIQNWLKNPTMEGR